MWFFVPFLLLVLPSSVSAQSVIEGRVVDPDGRAVAHATVLLVGPAGAPRSVETGADGRFVIAGIGEGRYDVSASAPGLTGEVHGLVVAGAAPVTADIVLRVRAVTETLVVSAAQVDLPLSRTADSVTILSGRDIEVRQVVSLGDALRGVAGFHVVQSGGPGTLTSLFPRGGESDFTLVLVDGVRANAFGGGLDLAQVPIADVERIEVVRGPQSAVHGADAIGGVVQVISRQGGAPAVQARVEGGSRRTRRAVASTSGGVGGWRWQGGGDFFADDGFTGVAPASLATGSQEARVPERVSNDQAQERQGWVGGGWRGARGTDIQGGFRYVDTDRGAPGPYGSDPAGRFTGVNRVARGTTARRSGGARIVYPWTGPASRVRQRLELDVADFDLRFVSAFGRSDSDTRRVHGRAQTDAALGAGIGASGGVEWLTERARSTFITAGAAAVPIERRVIGSFGELRWSAADRVTVQAGVRAEHIRREALAGNPSPFSPRPEFAADTVVSVNPKVSASWLVSPVLPGEGARAWTRLRASGGTGIRPPDAFEIAFTDNPALEPERSRSVEIGLTQALGGGAVQLELTAFYNRYDDLIVSVGSLRDVSRFRTDNVSNARSRGIELGGAWQAPRGARLRAGYTWLDTAILAVDGSTLAPSPFRAGDALLRRPRHQGFAALEWILPRASVFWSLAARSTTLDAEPFFGASGGLFDNPGYASSDAGGSVTVARGVEVFARVLNLFDRAYEEALGFPAPGRTAFAGVRVAVRR
jgi:outer membrane cobalamin receptor